jgi:hypothetical protein
MRRKEKLQEGREDMIEIEVGMYKGPITRSKSKQLQEIRESSTTKKEKDPIMGDREERNENL